MRMVNAAGLCRMYAMCMMMIMMMMYQDASDGMDNSSLHAPVGHAAASVSVSTFLDAPDGWNVTHTPAPDGMAHISDDMPSLSYMSFQIGFLDAAVSIFLPDECLSLESCAGSPAGLERWNTRTLESFEHVEIRGLSIEQISEYMISEVYRLNSYYNEQVDTFVEVDTVVLQKQTYKVTTPESQKDPRDPTTL